MKNEADDDHILPDVRYLYAETPDYIDPNDMLADVNSRRKAYRRSSSQSNEEEQSEIFILLKICNKYF